MGMRSRATDGRGVFQCQRKWPDQTLDHQAGCFEVLVAVLASRLPLQERWKSANIHASSGASGESPFNRETCTQTLVMAQRVSKDRAAFSQAARQQPS